MCVNVLINIAMQPVYNGWVETLPEFKYDVRLLVKEYQKYVIEFMTEMPTDRTCNVPTQSFFHVISDSKRRSPLDNMPYTQIVIDQLYQTYHFNYVGYRCIFPRRSLSWHYDKGKMCYHIPLITNPGCWFVYEGKSFHMPADGSVYIVNNQSMHTFVNAGDEPRIHFTLKKLT